MGEHVSDPYPSITDQNHDGVIAIATENDQETKTFSGSITNYIFIVW